MKHSTFVAGMLLASVAITGSVYAGEADREATTPTDIVYSLEARIDNEMTQRLEAVLDSEHEDWTTIMLRKRELTEMSPFDERLVATKH